MEIKIKYHDPELIHVEKITNGDWIDLRAAEDVHLNKGQFKLINLGVSMELPEGYEAHVIPRSSTFKRYHLLEANSMGLIDESYCGDDDIWYFPAYAVESTNIKKNDRICQFRIEKKMPDVDIVEVDSLGNENRGGIGSTGVQ